MDVVADIVTPAEETTIQVPPSIETTRSEIPKITFENVQDLQPGQYRLRPTGYSTRTQLGHSTIQNVRWGNVNPNGSLVHRADFPADAPKISLSLYIHPNPYELTVDGKPIIRTEIIGDEIVINLFGQSDIRQMVGGIRGDTFTYTSIHYAANLVENLDRPDIDIGFVETPEVTEPEMIQAEPIFITFDNALDLQPGKTYRFRPTHINVVNSHLKDEAWVNTIDWGNVLHDEPFQRGDFPDEPKIELSITPNHLINYFTPDGEPVIEYAVEGGQKPSDEIVVEIEELHVIVPTTGGEHGSQFEYTLVIYRGSVIENLTKPDIKFE
jgi:hypothetical protein